MIQIQQKKGNKFLFCNNLSAASFLCLFIWNPVRVHGTCITMIPLFWLLTTSFTYNIHSYYTRIMQKMLNIHEISQCKLQQSIFWPENLRKRLAGKCISIYTSSSFVFHQKIKKIYIWVIGQRLVSYIAK